MIDVEKILKSNLPGLFSKYPRFISNGVVTLLQKLIYQNDINQFLEKYNQLQGIEFIEKVLEYFNFSYRVSNKDIENIPASGRVLIISNHPLGALDAFSLLSLVGSIRKDVKIIANEILMHIDPIKGLLLPIDNMTGRQTKDHIRLIHKALGNEECVIIFPSGEVSRIRPTGVRDTKWHSGFLRFAKKSKAPILPIFINARNSSLFYTVSMIYKPAALFLLSHEMFNKRDKTITIKVGELIPQENIVSSGLPEKTQLSLLKRHLYRISNNKRGIFASQKCIAHPEDRQSIKKELSDAKLLGETHDNKKIYMVNYNKDSALMREIGRLREYTFRKVGEGTGKKRDIDSYDVYYKHLVLWDEDELEIVGAYRIGESDTIMKMVGGRDGFYIASLFELTERFNPYLESSIELGRSFVQPKYWGSRALDYLWFGIGKYLKHNPQIKYMYGPVSLSASYPKMAQNMVINYYSHYFGDPNELVIAKNRYMMTKQELEECHSIFDGDDPTTDFKTLKESLSHFNLSVPTLYKQYSDLCEEDGVKILDFNVDPDFENCIDAFMLVEVAKLKDSKRKRYIGDEIITEETVSAGK